MDKVLYKGYEIIPAPNQSRDSGECTINLYIVIDKGNERTERKFFHHDTYKTREEAINQCINFGKQIIDGKVENYTVPDQ